MIHDYKNIYEKNWNFLSSEVSTFVNIFENQDFKIHDFFRILKNRIFCVFFIQTFYALKISIVKKKYFFFYFQKNSVNLKMDILKMSNFEFRKKVLTIFFHFFNFLIPY